MLNDAQSWLRGPFIAVWGKQRINILCMILGEIDINIFMLDIFNTKRRSTQGLQCRNYSPFILTFSLI